MTDTSDEIVLSMDELREKNLKWFSVQFPAMHSVLKSYESASELVDEGNGWYNLEFSGQNLYEPTAKECIESQLEGFRKAPNRLNLGAPQPTNFDKYAANTLHRMIERIHNKGIEFSAFIPSTQSYYLMLFGFGLGGHVMKLVEETNCQCLIIIEPNMEFIAQSLGVFDWQKLHEVIEARGGYFDLCTVDNKDYIFQRIKGIVRTQNPCSLDGTVLFTNYNNTIFAPLQKQMRYESHIILSGLGFYFDETIMIANTYANLSTDHARMCRYSKSKIRTYPAFIVGSGPSLDKDIEWIRENQENAIIFSCGSAIMPLMRAGIQPEFQVELENVPELYPMLLDTIKYIDVSKVHLLATTTIDARIPGFFDETSFFFRPALSSYPTFARDEDEPLHNGSPSVTNAGLALAQHFGFRDFYIFGTDMGSKVQGLAHSKTAWQNSDEGCEVDIKFNIPVRGNFGGTVFTFDGMNWTRDELELAIKSFYMGRHYYNCSDGAYIAGTIAKHARSVKFKKHPAPKSTEYKAIVDMFKPYHKSELLKKWNDEDMRQSFADYLNAIKDCLEELDDIVSKRALTKMNHLLYATGKTGVDLGMAMIFRGTLWQALLGTEFYIVRVAGEENQEIAHKIYKEEITSLINYLLKKSLEDLGHMSEHEWKPRDREVVIQKEDWV